MRAGGGGQLMLSKAVAGKCPRKAWSMLRTRMAKCHHAVWRKRSFAQIQPVPGITPEGWRTTECSIERSALKTLCSAEFRARQSSRSRLRVDMAVRSWVTWDSNSPTRCGSGIISTAVESHKMKIPKKDEQRLEPVKNRHKGKG